MRLSLVIALILLPVVAFAQTSTPVPTATFFPTPTPDTPATPTARNIAVFYGEIGESVLGPANANNRPILDGGWITYPTPVTVPNGGTGAQSLTDHGVLTGSGADPITALTVGDTGEVLVGVTGDDPTWRELTADDIGGSFESITLDNGTDAYSVTAQQEYSAATGARFLLSNGITVSATNYPSLKAGPDSCVMWHDGIDAESAKASIYYSTAVLPGYFVIHDWATENGIKVVSSTGVDMACPLTVDSVTNEGDLTQGSHIYMPESSSIVWKDGGSHLASMGYGAGGGDEDMLNLMSLIGNVYIRAYDGDIDIEASGTINLATAVAISGDLALGAGVALTSADHTTEPFQWRFNGGPHNGTGWSQNVGNQYAYSASASDAYLLTLTGFPAHLNGGKVIITDIELEMETTTNDAYLYVVRLRFPDGSGGIASPYSSGVITEASGETGDFTWSVSDLSIEVDDYHGAPILNLESAGDTEVRLFCGEIRGYTTK